MHLIAVPKEGERKRESPGEGTRMVNRERAETGGAGAGGGCVKPKIREGGLQQPVQYYTVQGSSALLLLSPSRATTTFTAGCCFPSR